MKIKVMTYNVNKSRDATFTKDSSTKLHQFLKASGVDIIFLQEVIGSSDKRSIIECEFESLADDLWHDFSYGKNAISEGGHHGNAILSKFPIVESENVDISTNRLEQRGILFAKIEILKNDIPCEVDLFCLHLDLFQKGRDKQYVKLVKEISKTSHDIPLIVAGDFNDWNHRFANRLESELKLVDCGKSSAGKYLKTFPSYLPSLALDHIFVRGVEPLRTISSDFFNMRNLSDHLPLIFELEV